MKKRFSETQIIAILKQAQAVGNARDVCRRHNIAEQTFYRWPAKYAGLDVPQTRRLQAVERENAELKRLVGELSLDNRLLKEVMGKKW